MVYTPELYARVGMKTNDFEAGAAKVNKSLKSMSDSGGVFQRAFSKIGKLLDPTMLLSGFVGGIAAGGFLAIGSTIGKSITDGLNQALSQNSAWTGAVDKLNSSLSQLGAALAPILIALIPLIIDVANAIVDVANATYIVTGVLLDNTTTWQVRFQDLFNWLMGAIVDVVQGVIKFLGDLYKSAIEISNAISQGIANALIDGINSGIQGIVSGINSLITTLSGIPLIGEALKGKSVSFNAIGHIDLSAGTKAAQSMADQFVKYLIDTLEKGQKSLGWDQTLGDLAKKYGLNMNYFTPAAANLTNSVNGLKDTIDSNKLTQNIEISVHQVIEGTYSPEQLKALEDTTYAAVQDGLRDKGVGV